MIDGLIAKIKYRPIGDWVYHKIHGYEHTKIAVRDEFGVYADIGQVLEISGPAAQLEESETVEEYRERVIGTCSHGEVVLRIQFFQGVKNLDSLLDRKITREYAIKFGDRFKTIYKFEGKGVGFQPSFSIDDVLVAELSLRVGSGVE